MRNVNERPSASGQVRPESCLCVAAGSTNTAPHCEVCYSRTNTPVCTVLAGQLLGGRLAKTRRRKNRCKFASATKKAFTRRWADVSEAESGSVYLLRFQVSVRNASRSLISLCCIWLSSTGAWRAWYYLVPSAHAGLAYHWKKTIPEVRSHRCTCEPVIIHHFVPGMWRPGRDGGFH